MPILPETRRIADEEWKTRKSQILELFIGRGHTLKGSDGVIEAMKAQGFVATVPQYEHQFRKWGVRKNKNQVEWERIAGIAQQGEDGAQVDQYVPRAKLQRAQRRYALRGPQHRALVSRFHGSTNRTENSQSSSSESGQAVPPTHTDMIPNSTPIDAIIDEVILSDDILLSPPNGLCLVRSLAFAYTSDANLFSQHNWVPPLTSTKLVATIIKNIYDSPRHSTHNYEVSVTSGNILCKFLELVNEVRGHRESPPSPQLLYRLSSLNTFAGEDWSHLEQISNDMTSEARIDSRLITSLINGFSDVKDIPAGSIVKFLSRRHFMQDTVLNFLTVQQSPEAKALIEKLIIAFIAADEDKAVQHLLDNGDFDVNQAVWCTPQCRFTMLQWAAYSHSVKVCRLLIHQVTDVNKSFSTSRYSDSALDLLIRQALSALSLYGNRRLDENVLGLIDLFIAAKATVSIFTIDSVLEKVSDPRLIIILVKKIASQEPGKFVSYRQLGPLVKNLAQSISNEELSSIINYIKDQCRSYQLYELEVQISQLIFKASREEDRRLAEALFKFISDPEELLQDALKTKDRYIVQLILQLAPQLHEKLGDSEGFLGALRSGNRDQLRFLEEQGVLSHLDDVQLIEALIMALETGNLEYAIKIMDSDAYFVLRYEDPDHDLDDKFVDAFKAALAHKFDDIAWDFLSGAFIDPNEYLRVAVDMQRLDFVTAILQHGFSCNYLGCRDDECMSFDCDISIEGLQERDRWGIWKAAVENGDDSILDALWQVCACQNFEFDRSLLKLILERGHQNWFLKMVGCMENKDDALLVAVECEHESALDGLISIGARADNDDALKLAATKHYEMVRPLLNYYRKAYPQGRAHYGRKLVWEALRDYKDSHELFDNVLAWNLVTRSLLSQPPREDDILLHAAFTRKVEIVKLFIDIGADVNTSSIEVGSWRQTPLLQAISYGTLEIVKLLINRGANINQPAGHGLSQTPLQKAAEENDIEILRLLLENGAEVNAPPALFNGATALQFAAINGNCEMVAILIEHQAKLDVPPPIGPYGRWPLEGAAEHGRFDMIEFLWNLSGGHFDDQQTRKAMRLAEHNGHIGCKEKIEELVARSAALSDGQLFTASV